MKNKIINTGLLIPAAGRSSRMKTPKPFLKFNNDSTFIEQIIDSYMNFGIDYITVVIDPKHKEWEKIIKKYPNVDFIENTHIDYGRFNSVLLGMKKKNEIQNCFLQNIDNPFVSKEILEGLYELSERKSFVVPTYNNRGGHPILIPEEIIEYIRRIEDYSLNLRDVLSKFKRVNLEVDDPKILLNINTKEDYLKYI